MKQDENSSMIKLSHSQKELKSYSDKLTPFNHRIELIIEASVTEKTVTKNFLSHFFAPSVIKSFGNRRGGFPPVSFMCIMYIYTHAHFA